jgi:hypothetical protein
MNVRKEKIKTRRMQMRKFTGTALFVMIVFPAMAYANIFGDIAGGIGDWIINNAISSIITMVFMIIGALWGGTKWGKIAMKSKVPIQELSDVWKEVHEARKPTSDGGKTITAKEYDKILAEVEDAVKKTLEAIKT